MAKLSPVFNDAQFINGVPANGAKVFTYAAGSSTKLATYTDDAGTVPQANPIILNSRGEPESPIWLTEGQAYKFVFTASTDSDPPTSPIRTVDDVTGVGDNSVSLDQWVDSGVTPTYVSATQFTVPGDQTSAFHVNRRIKATVTAGTVYGYISASVFGALTTVTVSLDSGNLDSGLSAVQLGLITASNTSLPQITNWIKTSMIQDDAVTVTKIADSTLGFALINGTLTASVAGNALTVAVKTKAGTDPSATDPVLVVFRNATITDGTYSVVSITAATSLTVSSGSTLGTFNAQSARLAVLLINNAGTAELAINNLAGGASLDETGVISTTAEGGAGAADSATAVYSTTARANVAYRFVGLIDITEATAGTWATAPTKLTLVGAGQVLAMSSLGYGQTLSNPTRALSTTYYNTSGRPRFVFLAAYSTAGANVFSVSINGAAGVGIGQTPAANNYGSCAFIVPPGASYAVTIASGVLGNWAEVS